MTQRSTGFNTKFTISGGVPVFLFALTLAVCLAGCSKGSGDNERSDKNANIANANQPDQAKLVTPVVQPTLGGDIERASLAIAMARDAAKRGKWEDAVSQLRSARKEVEAALGRKPRLREEFEALRSAIDRAIPAVEGRGKEAAALLEQLQTRIAAIKVNSFTQ
jgi:hypothetical protein